MERTLFGLEQSAWTERARWALDHHGVRYAYHEHVPMLGEPLLRRKAGVKKASVPLFVDGDVVVMGSLDIAREAEKIGRGAPLFPRDADKEVEHWFEVGERMANVGRACFFRRFMASREAQRESLPGFVPGILRGVMAPSAGMAVQFLAKKWAVPEDVAPEVERVLRPALEEIRRVIGRPNAAGTPSYLLAAGARAGGPAEGAFTFADIAIAATLTVIKPRAAAKLGPATRETWTDPVLASEFADLLAWRDAVYAKHR